jgi:transcriptional regulator with XRE-family HTH domain
VSKNTLALKSLGEVLFRIRKEKQLSQDDLGKLAGTSQMTIKRLESSEVGTRLDNLIAVAYALEMNLTDLFREVEGNKASKKTNPNSKWGRVMTRIDELTSTEREWLASVLEDVLKSPWNEKVTFKKKSSSTD